PALRVQVLAIHLDAQRLILPVTLEEPDRGAEIADLHDLRLGDRGRSDHCEGGDRREHDGPGDALHEALLAGVDESMKVERTCAIRVSGSRSLSGAAMDLT